MGNTSQKVTKDKDPKRVDAGLKGRETFMKKMKENILIDAKKVAKILPIQAMKLPALLTIQVMKLQLLPTTPPQDQMILIFWRSYNCCTCHWRLCIFYIHHFPERSKTSQ